MKKTRFNNTVIDPYEQTVLSDEIFLRELELDHEL